MQVYLVRHGPSENRDPVRWPVDDDRPLSRSGVKETEEAARGLARLPLEATRVITSPAERARATAALVRAALGVTPPLERWTELAPDSPAEPALGRLHREGRRADRVVLVGHEPMLSELIGLALTGEALSLVHLARAGAASLVFDATVAPGAGRLDWLIPRRPLARLGR